MKKIIIFISVFAIIAIGITAGLIHSKKSGGNFLNIKSGDSLFSSEVNEKNEESSEKTIDLWSTYNQNDLVIDKESFPIDERKVTFEIPQIRGLKDKNVEIKVNDSIKEKIRKEVLEFVPSEGVTEVNYYDDTSYNCANFSNVISFYGYVSYTQNGKFYFKNIYFNYELVNGEELTLKDLFKKDEDISTIVRMALYKYISKNYGNLEGWGFNNVYYDNEKQGWYGEYIWYDDKTSSEKSEIRQFVPTLTDYEIEKLVKKFIKNGAKSFCFTPYYLEIKIDEINSYETRLYLKDIADKVVIYNKYLTKDSIYQEEGIGAKNIMTCSAETNFSKYKETKFETDNFFYDLDVNYEGYGISNIDEYPAKKYLEDKLAIEINKAKGKIQEHKEMADSNKDKAFFVITRVAYNFDVEHENGEDIFNNIFSTELKTKLFTCNIEQKEEVMNKIFNNSFRYYNLGFYNDAYSLIDFYSLFRYTDDYYKLLEGDLSELEREQKLLEIMHNNDIFYEEKIEQEHIYDALTGKEIKSVDEIFKDGIDYDQVIKNYFIEKEYEKEVKDGAKYILCGNCIEIDEGESYNRGISFSNLKQYLRIKALKPEILPSSERLIDTSELEEMDKEELDRAYNEIFARHGHDFKNAELKRYFSLWDWYEPISGKSVSMEELSEIEKANANLIRSVIDAKADAN